MAISVEAMALIAYNHIRELRFPMTFNELEELFEKNDFEYHGDLGLNVGVDKPIENVHAWYGWNEEACKVMNILTWEKNIAIQPEPIFSYWFDGVGWDFPLANVKTFKKGYKKEHWLPASIVYMGRK